MSDHATTVAETDSWSGVSGLTLPAVSFDLQPLLAKLQSSHNRSLVISDCGVNTRFEIGEEPASFVGSIGNKLPDVVGVRSVPLDEADKVDALVSVAESKSASWNFVQGSHFPVVGGTSTVAEAGGITSAPGGGR